MRGSHQRGHFHEPRFHAYAWTRDTPRIYVTYITKAMFTFKSPRIGVDISQQLMPMHESRASRQQRSRLSTALMRGLLLNPRTHQSYPTHMRRSKAYVWKKNSSPA
ncbi:hypothetical protein PIB30_066436 [Stylosanthes scabra]|uniref:Uncharacterized protein n=1 Tax=Stylosanthes scabra TaxID=79078 RepID=A0ABU6YL58_9FABA|nr:hypothetical protein [Stylosanthes scabra]